MCTGSDEMPFEESTSSVSDDNCVSARGNTLRELSARLRERRESRRPMSSTQPRWGLRVWPHYWPRLYLLLATDL